MACLGFKPATSRFPPQDITFHAIKNVPGLEGLGGVFIHLEEVVTASLHDDDDDIVCVRNSLMVCCWFQKTTSRSLIERAMVQ